MGDSKMGYDQSVLALSWAIRKGFMTKSSKKRSMYLDVLMK